MSSEQEQRIRQILGAAEEYAGHDFTCQECGLHPFLEDAIYAVLDGRPVPAYDFLVGEKT